MTQPHSPRPSAGGSPRARRLWAAGVGIVCGTVLGIGAWLHPDPRGYGTHMQLDQPACGSLVRTGYPCPSCGLTTSVSATVHGQFGLALRAQPFGLVLAAFLAAAFVASLWVLWTGRALPAGIRPRWWWLLPAGIGWLGGWGLNVWMGMRSGLYPLGQ